MTDERRDDLIDKTDKIVSAGLINIIKEIHTVTTPEERKELGRFWQATIDTYSQTGEIMYEYDSH